MIGAVQVVWTLTETILTFVCLRVAVLENKAELSSPLRRRSTAIYSKPHIYDVYIYIYIYLFLYSYFQNVVELGDPLRRRSTATRLLSEYIQM